MAKKLLISLFAVIIIAIIVSINTNVYTNVGGAPIGHTGSPGDNKTCATTGCHVTTAFNQNNLITSNVPGTGYIPGATYSFTASISQTSINRWGFQISPQSASGTYLGTLIATNTTETQIVGSTKKYITHKSAGTTGSGSKTWTFDWTAPAAGTGNVTFYGAFNAANNNGNTSGDQIYTSTLTVTEDLTASINDNVTQAKGISILPNPTTDNIKINAVLKESANTTINVYDINGRLVKILFDDYTVSGEFSVTFNISGTLPAGTYFIMLQNNDNYLLEKFIVLTK